MFENYKSIAKSIATLMAPFVEVVIHDLSSGRIAFIEGGLSQRDVGDLSNLEEDIKDWEKEVAGHVYPKLNHDGRPLKSITIPLKHEGNVVALMCINVDASLFHQLKAIAEIFLQGVQNHQPSSLFKKDWQERVHHFVTDYLTQRHLVLNQLKISEKKEMVKCLFDQGAFDEKNAVDYIAKILHMGRATIFNYLRKWRTHGENTDL